MYQKIFILFRIHLYEIQYYMPRRYSEKSTISDNDEQS